MPFPTISLSNAAVGHAGRGLKRTLLFVRLSSRVMGELRRLDAQRCGRRPGSPIWARHSNGAASDI